MAVQVFSGDELKIQNIQTIGDLVSSIPGLVEGQRQSAASSSYNIRGAGGSNVQVSLEGVEDAVRGAIDRYFADRLQLGRAF